MIRRIDDSMMVEMLAQGKLQKEIAEHFNVSPAAICKRVKRLQPIEEPESFKNLSQKEKKFALEVAEGKTQTQAAMNSFDVTTRDSAKSIGSELMAKPDIQMAVSELMQEEGLTRRHRVKRLKEHVDHLDPNVSLKALDQSWKLEGLYTDNYVLHVVSYSDLTREYSETCKEEIELLRKKGRDKEADALEIVSEGFIEAEVIEEDTEDSRE